jgi:BirA family biotin operon repressor/biotin-[acetyl-CoA-carboxylase] ligase
VAEALEAAAGIAARIKWPNDVLLEGRKVAGILLEAAEGEVVCGIGVNVNQAAEELPREARVPPVSLRVAAGREHDRACLLADLLARLESRYGTWLAGGLAAQHDELRRRDALLGRALRAGIAEGVGAGIAPDGRLAVATPAGAVVLVDSGEVELTP